MTLRSTSVLRGLWGPPCRFRKATVSLYGTGRVTVDYRIVQAVYALNRCLIRHNYRTIYSQTGAYVCRAITGGTGYSLHAYGIAIDINWLRNGYGDHAPHEITDALANDIKAIRTNNGAQVWGWGGDYTSAPKDWMHFEIVASPAELANGIASSPMPQPEELTVAQIDDLIKKIDAVNLRLDAIGERLDKAESDRWRPSTIRTRENRGILVQIAEKMGLKVPPSEA